MERNLGCERMNEAYSQKRAVRFFELFQFIVVFFVNEPLIEHMS